MILPDINLLVYAYNADAPHHAHARAWWEDVMSEERIIALPWAVALGFVRLVSHRAVCENPLSLSEGLEIVGEWLRRSHVRTVEPGPRHLAILQELLAGQKIPANLVTDAHLAAIAIEHRCELHSNDLDFARFSGLRWTNPLDNAK